MLTTQPIWIAVGVSTREGRLVMMEDALVAVLTEVTEEDDPDAVGSWILETGYGPCEVAVSPMFSDVEEACGWLAKRVRANTSK